MGRRRRQFTPSQWGRRQLFAFAVVVVVVVNNPSDELSGVPALPSSSAHVRFMLRATKTSIPRTISPETIVLDNCFSYHGHHAFLFPYTIAERLSVSRSRIYDGDVWRPATAQYHRIRILSVFTRECKCKRRPVGEGFWLGFRNPRVRSGLCRR